jgi:2'-hydroxyisoflavone reductase
VTLLHRGLSGPGLFGDAVEHLIADRDASLPVLAHGRRWDCVIDTSAYFPRQLRAVADWLRGRVGQFQFVSSISAYADPQAAGGLDELDGPLAALPAGEPEPTVLSGANYGALKAACEHAATAAFGDAHRLIVRPGLIVGPHDPTGRFDWWLRRLQRGGEVLAPAADTSPVQWIDARDLAAWMLEQARAGTTGVFNLTGPTRADEPRSYRAWLEALRETVNPEASVCWAEEDWALAQGVAPWSDWPLWLPSAMAGLHRTPIERARASGLSGRPLRDTVADTLAWLAARPADAAALPSAMQRPAAGLDPAREAELLRAWRQGRADAAAPLSPA